MNASVSKVLFERWPELMEDDKDDVEVLGELKGAVLKIWLWLELDARDDEVVVAEDASGSSIVAGTGFGDGEEERGGELLACLWRSVGGIFR